ncbi:bifunctional UDP-N-acetylmuramoyl-tripeptide:D-alanyl-D-alanine ligase/alanine racemase [Pedobacter sp. LMG 31464]|uniref:Alanine racemase n=1 Tax=Pedobacter planticolens TaxID=2679964 RepID=A0A923IU22_9SPHI|nr:bifunctional UDP-N-acetylmuramoyl-tripeptide:D-alanyl-D-alanine ligase/alanine racemase [Pedobacter planticolens]MBB2144406.1 bifunctional UDP-N-acetylmuramoyl-tripeptide:D-alanyl-D-alanine ligase/alanine racemase [Pedobacter planticolens]
MSEEFNSIQHIAQILKAKATLPQPKTVIRKLLTDSRTVIDPEGSLFFAVKAQRDGHEFIVNAYESGIRNFVVSNSTYAKKYPDVNFLLVVNVLQALQELATYRRKANDLKVIGITGSNGKTIVKEWLYQLLASDFNIIRSPKSFNSQIGVPLSVWQIEPEHTLGIFEAGISTKGEMEALATIIVPTIGVLTNIGEAHAEGFENKREKLTEKLKLFKDVELFVYAPEYVTELNTSDLPGKTKFTWSTSQPADLQISFIEPIEGKNYIRATYQDKEIECLIPFSDKASVENGIICWATLLAMGYSPEEADLRLEKLTQVSMRLQLIIGIENCSIIDDSYSADISSLAIALDFLNLQNQHPKKTLILSDIYETGKSNEVLYAEISALLDQKNLNRLIGIGPNISAFADLFKVESSFYESTQAFIEQLPAIHFANETILVKGARRFEFGRISKLLTQKIHDTVLEINLNALASNLQFYRSKLKSGVKVMAMVKAFSYGSGSFEIANLLQYQKVDYLAVAYADEGIALRKAGISLPIMVMSPEPSAFEAMVKHKLEPEIYNTSILKSFLIFLPEYEVDFPIHLKLDTGMHRLGFEKTDLPELLDVLKNTTKLKVVSIFTHLVASDSAQHDGFTTHQLDEFSLLYTAITNLIDYKPLKHALNTSGITRWPDAQLDMVRIGIGLYGFDSALDHNSGLQTVAILKTTVTQVKELKPGETVGYSRKGVLPNGGKIATVKIGYADGYNRNFGNGVGKMLINGKLVPTIGSICMDMCMLDITGLNVKTGDEVIVFNHQQTIVDLADQINTIPYEILTNISQRVKRVYFYE